MVSISPPPNISPSSSYSPKMTLDFSIIQDHVPHDGPIPKYRPFNVLTHPQPTRATCFHPSGEAYVVGSNSRVLSVCLYPSKELRNEIHSDEIPIEPELGFKFLQIHRGSVYCVAFNQKGDLLASGSNDQTVNIIRYDADTHAPHGDEFKLNIHSGTVRDLAFMKNENDHLLLTGGAGDHAIYATDTNSMKRTQAFREHQSPVMSIHTWDSSNKFVSGSLDGSIRFWDIRTKSSVACVGRSRCMTVNSTADDPNATFGKTESQAKRNGDSVKDLLAPVGVVRVDPSGQLLVSGHKDGSCMLYDIRGKRIVQSFQAHEGEIRTLNLGPKLYYLLSGGYDRKVKLMDLQGDLTKKLPSVEIAELEDKVIQTAWHPIEQNFVTTSADGSATLWTMTE